MVLKNLLTGQQWKKKLFIYLIAPGLSCGTQDLPSSLQRVGSSSLTRDQTLVPYIGNTVLSTGPPGKCQ